MPHRYVIVGVDDVHHTAIVTFLRPLLRAIRSPNKRPRTLLVLSLPPHIEGMASILKGLSCLMVGSNEEAKDELIRAFRDLIDSVVEEEEDELEFRLLAEEGDDYDVLRLQRLSQ